MNFSQPNTEELLTRIRELEDLYNNAPCGYHSLDRQGYFVHINDTELKWLGYAREEIVGRRKLIEFLPPEGQELFRQYSPVVFANGRVDNLRLELLRRDGTTIPVLATVSAIVDEAGNFVRSRSTLFEATELHRTETEMLCLREAQQRELEERAVALAAANQELQTAAERYRVLFDNHPVPMWVYDPETLKFLSVSEVAVHSYGWTREELLTMCIWDLCPPEDLPKLQRYLKTPAAERPQGIVWRHRKKDGTIIDVEIFARDLIFDERRVRLAIAYDVTERKRLEANLLRAQRLESIGVLAGGIAHDLNNVFSPLTMSLYLLRSRITDSHSREILDTLEEMVTRGSQLVRQVLLFARGSEDERTPLDPARLLREMTSVLRETFPRNIQIEMHSSDGLPFISGNLTQIHQVLMNLCVNARDAMPDGGRLSISAALAVMEELQAKLIVGAKPGYYVLLKVRDTGIGVSSDIIDKIFDPFFTTKKRGQGTGLGLATSLGIVQSHGGFIQVSSEADSGTEFSIWLPALPHTVETRVTGEQPEPPSGKGELILVVDDEAAILRVAKGALEAFDYRVLTAADGIAALSLIEERKNELRAVLTDMMMPVMDGAALLNVMQTLHPHLPVIAGSGLADQGREAHALAHGARKFLSKPYTTEKLLWALHEVLQAEK